MPIPDQIVESVAIDNVKSVAGGSAFYSNLNMANSVYMQQLSQQESLAAARAMEVARLNAVHGGSKYTYELGLDEARAGQKLASGDETAQQAQAILGALNAAGQGVKSMGITPPPTASSTV
jgi:hypothetical protein